MYPKQESKYFIQNTDLYPKRVGKEMFSESNLLLRQKAYTAIDSAFVKVSLDT